MFVFLIAGITTLAMIFFAVGLIVAMTNQPLSHSTMSEWLFIAGTFIMSASMVTLDIVFIIHEIRKLLIIY